MNDWLKEFFLTASVGDLWYLSNAGPMNQEITRFVFAATLGNTNVDHSQFDRDVAAQHLNTSSEAEKQEIANYINAQAAIPAMGGIRPPKGDIVRK